MDLGIRGKVALVTGASSGIGAAVALALAAEGASLAVAARRRDRLEDVAVRCRAAGAADARPFEADVSDPRAIEALVRDVSAALGAPDILVANSGGPKAGKVLDLSIDDWDTAYRGVLRNIVSLAYAVVPGMRQKQWGRIVALESTSVKQPIPTLALSNAFRVALVAAFKTLSFEVAADGITVNTIATGRVLTDRLRNLYGDEESLESAAQEVPVGRIASAEEFAPMVAFLCGQPASYVTGQTIAIDGGLIKNLF